MGRADRGERCRGQPAGRGPGGEIVKPARMLAVVAPVAFALLAGPLTVPAAADRPGSAAARPSTGIGTPSVVGTGLGPRFTQDVYETAADHRVRYRQVRHGRVIERVDLGGWSRTGVTAALLGEGTAGTVSRQLVVVQGRDRAVWFRERLASGRWTPWRTLGGVVTARPGILLTADEAGQVVVVVGRGRDGAMWERVRDRHGWTPGWRRIGGRLSGGPAVAGVVAYVHGPGGQLWAADRGGPAAAGWSAWRRLPALPGRRTIVGEPGVASNRDGVYVLDRRGVAWLWSGAGWQRIGGGFRAAPVSVTQLVAGRERVSLFARRADGRLYYRGSAGWKVLR
jgi:hypothetical protein